MQCLCLEFFTAIFRKRKTKRNKLFGFLPIFIIGVIITICKGFLPLIRRGVIINKESKYDSTYMFGQIEEIQYISKWTGFRYYPGLLDRNSLYPMRFRTQDSMVNRFMKNQTEFSKEVIFSELYGAEIKIKNKWCFIIIPKWFCKEDVVRIKYSPHSKCIIEMSYWDGAE